MMNNGFLTKKERITYIVIAAVCMVATFPGRTNGLGFITEFVLADLHIDRTVYGYYNMAATLAGALFCIPVGLMLDRYGCRRVLSVVLSALGVAVLLTGVAGNSFWFVASLVLTRGFGQSALSVASMTLISKYFLKKDLGSAMGLYSVLTAVFFMTAFWAMGEALTSLSPLHFSIGQNEFSIAHWQVAWGCVGLILIFICVPAVLIFIRPLSKTPLVESDCVESEQSREQTGFRYRQALRTSIFWVFALSIAFFGLVNSGIALYNENILSERGFDAQMYYFLMVLPLPFALASNLLVGYLTRHIKITHLLAGSLFVMGTVKLLFPLIHTAPQVYGYAIALAVSGGGLTVLFFVVWANVFGRRDVGRIQGAAQMMSVFASAAGPVFFAYSKELTNSYSPAFYISGAITLVFAVAACFVKIPVDGMQNGL